MGGGEVHSGMPLATTKGRAYQGRGLFDSTQQPFFSAWRLLRGERLYQREAWLCLAIALDLLEKHR
ncbi:hypothetical protein R84865_001740 [Carnimonas sp. R-84865]